MFPEVAVGLPGAQPGLLSWCLRVRIYFVEAVEKRTFGCCRTKAGGSPWDPANAVYSEQYGNPSNGLVRSWKTFLSRVMAVTFWPAARFTCSALGWVALFPQDNGAVETVILRRTTAALCLVRGEPPEGRQGGLRGALRGEDRSGVILRQLFHSKTRENAHPTMAFVRCQLQGGGLSLRRETAQDLSVPQGED